MHGIPSCGDRVLDRLWTMARQGDDLIGYIAGFDDFELDLGHRRLRYPNRSTRILDQQTYDLLAAFVVKAGSVLPRIVLSRYLWPDRLPPEPNRSLALAVRRLRGAITDGAPRAIGIQTFPSSGYRWTRPVSWRNAAADDKAPISKPEFHLPRDRVWTSMPSRQISFK